MDQMISATGEAGYALPIDCRSLDTQAVPLPGPGLVFSLPSLSPQG
jgi:galactokinase